MNSWLNNYVYSISLGFMLFFIPGLIAIVLTAVTISFHAYKAAVMNPVESIKDKEITKPLRRVPSGLHLLYSRSRRDSNSRPPA